MQSEIDCCRNTSCCFTGHRLRDLPFGGDIRRQGMKCLVSTLQLAIEEAVREGYDTFLSGMAQGVDLICAKIVHDLRVSRYHDLKLICVIPYRSQGTRDLSDPLDRYTYSMVLNNCHQVHYVSQSYYAGCYKDRNQLMVDNSSKIIGVYKEKKTGSGTLQTINMAKRAGLEGKIICLDKNPIFYADESTAIPISADLKITLYETLDDLLI